VTSEFICGCSNEHSKAKRWVSEALQGWATTGSGDLWPCWSYLASQSTSHGSTSIQWL